jgi:hypothetical protein
LLHVDLITVVILQSVLVRMLYELQVWLTVACGIICCGNFLIKSKKLQKLGFKFMFQTGG